MPFNYIFDRLIGECAGGVTVDQAAKEAHRISEQLGIPVFVRHNDRLYRITLDAAETEGPARGEK